MSMVRSDVRQACLLTYQLSLKMHDASIVISGFMRSFQLRKMHIGFFFFMQAIQSVGFLEFTLLKNIERADECQRILILLGLQEQEELSI